MLSLEAFNNVSIFMDKNIKFTIYIYKHFFVMYNSKQHREKNDKYMIESKTMKKYRTEKNLSK